MSKEKVSRIRDLVASAFGTVIAEFATIPICTLKTNAQIHTGVSIPRIAKNLYSERGLRGFYSASVPAIASQVVATCSRYSIYRALQRRYGVRSHRDRMLFGFVSGCVTSIVTHPIDVVRINYQAGKKDLVSILKRPYRGYSKSFGKVLVGSMTYIPLYDLFYERTKSPLAASFASAIVSTTLIHPVDYLKTRHIYGASLYDFVNPLRYYRGFGLNLARVVPHFTITMVIVDLATKYLF